MIIFVSKSKSMQRYLFLSSVGTYTSSIESTDGMGSLGVLIYLSNMLMTVLVDIWYLSPTLLNVSNGFLRSCRTKSLVACRTSVTSGMIINETRGSGNNRMFYFLIYVIDNFSCSGLANRATLFSVYKFQDNMDTIFSMEDIVMFNDVTINTKYF